MKLPLQHKSVYRFPLVLLLTLLLPFIGKSQTFVTSVSSVADNGSAPGTTATIVAPAGLSAGDLVVIYTHYRTNSGSPSVTTAAGQTWQSETNYAGANQTANISWCRFNGTWVGNPVVTAAAATGTIPLTAVMYVFRPNNPNSSWGIHTALTSSTSSTSPMSITGITTTAPRTVTMAFWASSAANAWTTLSGAGWVKPTGAAQYRNISGSDQTLSSAYFIRTTAGNVVATGQSFSPTANTIRSLISFYELNDNCNAAQPIASNTSCSYTNGSLQNAASSSVTPSCGNAASPDVWYSFTAQTANPTIAVTNLGASLNTAGLRYQVLDGSCGAFTAATTCQSGTSVSASGLTVGNTYYIRITTNNSGAATSGYNNWDFDLCVTDPVPANDNCAGDIPLTVGTGCTTANGNLYPATNSSVTISPTGCAPTVFDDVWYSFVAQRPDPLITLAPGAGFTNTGMQLLSDNCGGTFTSLFCSNTNTLQADYLTPGTTYFLRVYSTTNITAGAPFTVCVTDPVAPVPANDNCAGAYNLPVTPTCSNTPGTVSGATLSAVPGSAFGCSGTVAYDIWYKFTAISVSSTIAISSAGSGFSTPRIQLFTGSCTTSLVSVACNATGTLTQTTVPGTTYYVRVYSATGPAPNSLGNFDICVTAGGTNAPLVRYGNSYVNVTRKTTGGVVLPGDILEIRMTINHTVSSGTFRYLRFVDNIPTNTSLVFSAPHDSVKVITNEGLTYKKYQLLAATDPLTYTAAPTAGQYNLRLNLGFGGSAPGNSPLATTAQSTATGTMASSNRPAGGGGMLFAIAYRVQVSALALPGTIIQLTAPQFIYNNGSADITLTGSPFKIYVSSATDPSTLCANASGVNIAGEFGGTFGTGTSHNRSTDLTNPIPGYSFVSTANSVNTIGDGRYALVKNISPKSSTYKPARQEPNCLVGPTLGPNDANNCNNRMYGHWDIDGDHSGTSNAAGNAPPASTGSGGYMLVVNADYVASEIFRQKIFNLCPNTYYEFSCWIRNICSTCGVDSTGSQFAGTTTAPSAGYVGVFPNLAFLLDDVDYYNTGEVALGGWLKKGFVFQTGSTQTEATFSIRNNAQGGGGNDWALDDISVATCLPNMNYSPTLNPSVCDSNSVVIRDTVRSYFSNYIHYKWQRYTTSSGVWTDIAGTSGTAISPNMHYNTTLNCWEYITSYTVPTTETYAVNNGDRYRVIVATTSDNLSSGDCQVTDGVSIITLEVLDCATPLSADLLSFNGRLSGSNANLTWTVSRETEPVTYIIERSSDGINFATSGRLPSTANSGEIKNYSFVDPVPVVGKVWYRLVISNGTTNKKYSRIILLRKDIGGFNLGTVVNPFNNELIFEITTNEVSHITSEIIDMSGKILRKAEHIIYAGTNSLNILNTAPLPAGIYTLRIRNKDNILATRVMKIN